MQVAVHVPSSNAISSIAVEGKPIRVSDAAFMLGEFIFDSILHDTGPAEMLNSQVLARLFGSSSEQQYQAKTAFIFSHGPGSLFGAKPELLKDIVARCVSFEQRIEFSYCLVVNNELHDLLP